MIFFLGRIGHLVDLQIRCCLSINEILSSDQSKVFLRCHECIVKHWLTLLQDGLILIGVAYDSADTSEHTAVIVLMHLGDEDYPICEGNLSVALRMARISFLLRDLDEEGLEFPNALRRVEH